MKNLTAAKFREAKISEASFPTANLFTANFPRTRPPMGIRSNEHMGRWEYWTMDLMMGQWMEGSGHDNGTMEMPSYIHTYIHWLYPWAHHYMHCPISHRPMCSLLLMPIRGLAQVNDQEKYFVIEVQF